MVSLVSSGIVGLRHLRLDKTAGILFEISPMCALHVGYSIFDIRFVNKDSKEFVKFVVLRH